jgi:hypothetical protein
MIINVFGQANAGKTNTKGMPGMRQLAERSEKQRAQRLLGAGPTD